MIFKHIFWNYYYRLPLSVPTSLLLLEIIPLLLLKGIHLLKRISLWLWRRIRIPRLLLLERICSGITDRNSGMTVARRLCLRVSGSSAISGLRISTVSVLYLGNWSTHSLARIASCTHRSAHWSTHWIMTTHGSAAHHMWLRSVAVRIRSHAMTTTAATI